MEVNASSKELLIWFIMSPTHWDGSVEDRKGWERRHTWEITSIMCEVEQGQMGSIVVKNSTKSCRNVLFFSAKHCGALFFFFTFNDSQIKLPSPAYKKKKKQLTGATTGECGKNFNDYTMKPPQLITFINILFKCANYLIRYACNLHTFPEACSLDKARVKSCFVFAVTL